MIDKIEIQILEDADKVKHLTVLEPIYGEINAMLTLTLQRRISMFTNKMYRPHLDLDHDPLHRLTSFLKIYHQTFILNLLIIFFIFVIGISKIKILPYRYYRYFQGYENDPCGSGKN